MTPETIQRELARLRTLSEALQEKLAESQPHQLKRTQRTEILPGSRQTRLPLPSPPKERRAGGRPRRPRPEALPLPSASETRVVRHSGRPPLRTPESSLFSGPVRPKKESDWGPNYLTVVGKVWARQNTYRMTFRDDDGRKYEADCSGRIIQAREGDRIFVKAGIVHRTRELTVLTGVSPRVDYEEA